MLDGLINPPVGVSTFQNRRPFFVSGFVRPMDEPAVRFPAMNLCIDYKTDMQSRDKDFYLREHYVAYVFPPAFVCSLVNNMIFRQCGLYLVSNSVAYTQLTSHDQPFMTLGVVTDGKVFTFLVWNFERP